MALTAEMAAGWRCDLQGQIQPASSSATQRKTATINIGGYARPEDDSFLSYPEWYIVWSYQEKADYQHQHLPSGFPYFGAVRQYWGSYCCISRLIRGEYRFNGGEQVMLIVIGSSFSAEYILKGVYEKTIGKLSEWSSDYQPTEEDQFAYTVAREYADFVHVRPFYEFHFAKHVSELWRNTHVFGPHSVRKWERKLFLSADYIIEAFYCWVIEELTHVSYGYEPSETYAWVENASSQILQTVPHVTIRSQVGPDAFVLEIPRYQEFTTVTESLARSDVRFVEIAGNSQITLSLLAPKEWDYHDPDAHQLFTTVILSNPEESRMLLVCPVKSLSAAVARLQAGGAMIEHIYDY